MLYQEAVEETPSFGERIIAAIILAVGSQLMIHMLIDFLISLVTKLI